MKYPNDFLKERSRSGLEGQQHKAALDRVGAPFLTKRSPITTTVKKDEFTEARIIEGEPDLFGYLLLIANGTILPTVLDVEDEESFGLAVKLIYKLGPAAANVSLSRAPFVGDNFVLTLWSNEGDVDGEAVTHWPILALADETLVHFLAADPARLGKATSWIDDIQISGLLTPLHTFAFTCSGWDNDQKRFRFGLAFTYYTDPTNSTTRNATRAPIFFVGNTGEQTMEQVAFPYYAGRKNYAVTPFVVGKGRLQALQVVEEDKALTQLAPFLANSTDHGETWASAAASFLDAYLYEHPADGPDRAYYNNQQLTSLGYATVITYLGKQGGNHKTIMLVNSCLKDRDGDCGDAPPYGRFVPMVFLGTDGANYTKLDWPPDIDWFVSANGSSLATSYLRFFAQRQDFRSCQFGFGVGCMYMPVRHEGANNKILFTRDFGSTWQFSPPLPGLMNTNNFTNFGTPLEPYEGPTKKGQIAFIVPDYTTNKLAVMVTDGDFTTFKQVASYKARGPLDDVSEPDFNTFFTNFGGTREPYIFPAFPGEFE